MAIIQCADCGEERRGPKNTKYCHMCRLARDAEFWTGKTVKCRKDHGGCGQAFAPINRNDSLCGKCNPGVSAWRGNCVLCGKDDTYRVMRTLAVCKSCARDPAKRVKFVKGLRRRQAERKAANAAPADV